jgi:hypothetical protein
MNEPGARRIRSHRNPKGHRGGAHHRWNTVHKSRTKNLLMQAFCLMFYLRGRVGFRPEESDDCTAETALGYNCSFKKSPLLLGKASPPPQAYCDCSVLWSAVSSRQTLAKIGFEYFRTCLTATVTLLRTVQMVQVPLQQSDLIGNKRKSLIKSLIKGSFL